MTRNFIQKNCDCEFILTLYLWNVVPKIYSISVIYVRVTPFLHSKIIELVELNIITILSYLCSILSKTEISYNFISWISMCCQWCQKYATNDRLHKRDILDFLWGSRHKLWDPRQKSHEHISMRRQTWVAVNI